MISVVIRQGVALAHATSIATTAWHEAVRIVVWGAGGTTRRRRRLLASCPWPRALVMAPACGLATLAASGGLASETALAQARTRVATRVAPSPLELLLLRREPF